MRMQVSYHDPEDVRRKLESLVAWKVSSFTVKYIDTFDFTGWIVEHVNEGQAEMDRKAEIESIVDKLVKKLDVNK
ncbi:MAG: hypothetical protein ACW99U_21415 [Candidatus Thorarchaeota archaeon]|jgi:hypothetical protein